MRKILLFLPLILILAVSCTLDTSTVLDNRTGSISFVPDVSRGITASIEYPSLLDKVWTLVATKLDDGARTGEGQYEDIVLTDSLGPFSVGAWRFAITSADGSIAGSVETTIRAGSNSVAITVRSTASKGTLSVEDCSFLESKIGAKVNYVDCYVDEQRVNGMEWVVGPSMTTDGDLYTLPTITMQLPGGIHTIRLYFGADNGGKSTETVSFRVVNGMTTHFSIGEQEGNLAVTVAFDVVDALVEE